MTPHAPITAEELPYVQPLDKRTELVRGVMRVREPPGFRHGVVAMRLARALGRHADQDGLGEVLATEIGYVLERSPDTVRAPDVAFIRRDRVPDPAPAGYAELAPDLVVEVLSPGDRPGEVLAKVGDWLSAGSRLVWVVDPQRRMARVYRADGSESVVGESDALEGEDVLPGLSCRLAEVL